MGLLGLPRKNGKSALGSGLALQGLFDEPGAEVYSCAGDKEQARIVFGEARKAIEADDELAGILRVYRDAIEYPATSAVYRVLSAEAYTKEGLNPSRVIFDEVHVQPNDELWNVMNLGSGTRAQPLVLGITTAGVRSDLTGQDSVCYRMFQYGRRLESGEIDDPTFFFRWYGAPDGADHRDPNVWRAANPALGDFLYEEDFEVALRTVPEAEFRTKRLNQWVNSTRAWLPQGTWEACKAAKTPCTPKCRYVLGFDGSWTGDSTGIAACCIEHKYLFVVASWERKPGERDFRVDYAEVDRVIRDAYDRYNVVEIAADPHEWRAALQQWENDRLPVTEWPTNSLPRMVPATKEFYAAVVERRLTHDGDPRLARHMSHAVIKEDRYGARITKDQRNSPRKIDLAIAAIIAFDRAVEIGNEPPGRTWHAFLV